MLDSFNSYRDITKIERTNNIITWDGRMYWHTIKNDLSIIENNLSWKANDEFAIKVLSTLDEKDSELNHFMLQCVRIPRNDICCERKIMQIALNIGQMESELQLIQPDEKFLTLYKEFKKLNMLEYEAYIN